jgi:DNA-binding NtrC family response regulator
MALDSSYSLFAMDSGQRTQQILEQISMSNCPVLLVGEPGTGKRSIASRIHEASARKEHELMTVRCETATVTELQRSLKSAGTVYLESVAELSSAAQNALLAQVSAGHNSEEIARIICQTTHPLGEAVRSGKLSEDFFYAVAGVTLHTVPLRHRRAGLTQLAEHFLGCAARDMKKPKPVLNDEFKRFLMSYNWPGNLTELESAMKACVLIGNQEIALSALQASAAKVRAGANGGISLKDVARTASMKAEREIISEVLSATGGNRKQAARELKISYKALLYKLKRIGAERTSA